VLERVYRGHQASTVIFVTALVLATTMRFRVHITLGVLPAFLFIALYLWRRKHENVFLLAGFSAAVLAGLLYFEMRSPVYLQGTTNLRLGYSGLTESPDFGSWFTSWPFAELVHDWLRRLLHQPNATKWVWEVTCLSMFSLVDVIGIPLLAATLIYLATKRARRVFAPFNFLVLSAIVTSICFSVILASSYDISTLGVGLTFLTRWYLFPFEGVALWWMARFVQKRFSWPAAIPLLREILSKAHNWDQESNSAYLKKIDAEKMIPLFLEGFPHGSAGAEDANEFWRRYLRFWDPLCFWLV